MSDSEIFNTQANFINTMFNSPIFHWISTHLILSFMIFWLLICTIVFSMDFYDVCKTNTRNN